jgi:hypothetical protein
MAARKRTGAPPPADPVPTHLDRIEAKTDRLTDMLEVLGDALLDDPSMADIVPLFPEQPAPELTPAQKRRWNRDFDNMLNGTPRMMAGYVVERARYAAYTAEE